MACPLHVFPTLWNTSPPLRIPNTESTEINHASYPTLKLPRQCRFCARRLSSTPQISPRILECPLPLSPRPRPIAGSIDSFPCSIMVSMRCEVGGLRIVIPHILHLRTLNRRVDHFFHEPSNHNSSGYSSRPLATLATRNQFAMRSGVGAKLGS
ncbi:hypothetical protein DL93DRAFT_117354 [Clavulina sp. PMI_390]|nr:hypothetical protein DL93DRAFT_117354 [Clavulina sp. PMI_390]